MKPGRDTVLPRIAEVRRVSDAYLVGEAVVPVHRARIEQAAIDLGLLDRGDRDWRREQVRGELIGALLLARDAGVPWSEVVRVMRVAAMEVRLVELERGKR